MNWSAVPITKFCKTGSGGTPSRRRPEYYNGATPWVKSGELRENTIFKTEEYISKEAVKYSSAKIISKGAILIAMYGATIGRVAILGIDAATNQAVCHIIPDRDKADSKFLFYALRNTVPELLKRKAGGAQPIISQAIIKDTKIPLPPLSEQKRIAAILDKADAIRSKRGQAIHLADEFLQSVFLDMFGDPVMNNKGWKRCKFEEVLGNIDSGWSPKCHDRAANPDEWGVLKLGAVTSCRYLGQENKALPCDLEPKRDIEVKKGDLLFTRKNTYELVAACAFVYETRPRLMLSDTIFRFNFQRNAAIFPEYAWALFTHPGKRRELQKLAGCSAGSMPNISKSRLMKQLIELPPIELQDKFKIVFYTVRSCIESQSSAHNLATEFFNSLSQRAFRGEL